MIDFFDIDNVKLLYMDTGMLSLKNCSSNLDLDSFFLALTDSLDNLVKQDKRNEWFNKIKAEWFVVDYSNVRECKKPGKTNTTLKLLILLLRQTETRIRGK